jgi:hypothetical protein
MATILGDFLEHGKEFDRRNLLPADESWSAFQPDKGAALVDLGAFSSELGLSSHWTHTDLVPSAIDGYNPEAHTGAAGAKEHNGPSKGKGKGGSKGKSGDKGKGGGKGKGSYTGKGKNY